MKRYLITTLPSNDIGLLTRSLPIALELKNRGHQVAFCSPAKAPTKLISAAGFENFRPSQFPYYFISADFSLEAIARLLFSRHLKRDVGLLFSFIRSMTRSSTAEIWNIDHFMHLMGMWNQTLIRANVETLIEIISAYKPDVIVDFWNPFACIAARVCHRLLVTVIQADMHPQSQGFIWWKQVSGETPSPVPATNTILAEYGLPSINKMGELLIGDMTLVLGMPGNPLLGAPRTAIMHNLAPCYIKGSRPHDACWPHAEWTRTPSRKNSYMACGESRAILIIRGRGK